MTIETIGVASVGGTIGVFKSISILWTGTVNAIPDLSEIIHTAILAIIGAVLAIIIQRIYRKLWPKKK